ncbi:MAG: phenylacetate--CoA ligase family protein, partial [Alphaproteobacteria bacterium]
PHYHVQSENVLVEILDKDGKPCPPGEVGRLVVTDFHNFATPLIRYEIGDYAEAGEPCSCGRGLPVLRRILGRVRNIATLPSGEKFWPRFYSDDLAGIAPVRQVQLVQRSVHDIDVRLVVARALTGDEEERLKSVILEYLGHPFTLRFTYVDEIPRSASGKYEDFLSVIDQ